jgi:uncharacterized protein (DUF3084 family)
MDPATKREVEDLKRRVRALEQALDRLKRDVSDAGRYLKQSSDPATQRAGRELY